ncbi:hypothetical protein GCM10008986_16510 [Salinibacillus aidingensis]|uniref:Uncharacterized protein n=1 Tax=Salinibacillus aidingensis TaxID=237684 RepID=A0ABP3L1C8_9BACI
MKRKSEIEIEHFYFPFWFLGRKIIIAFVWAKNKGDWWYKGDDESTRRFFWIERSRKRDMTQNNLYFGRLAMSLMVGNS